MILFGGQEICKFNLLCNNNLILSFLIAIFYIFFTLYIYNSGVLVVYSYNSFLRTNYYNTVQAENDDLSATNVAPENSIKDNKNNTQKLNLSKSKINYVPYNPTFTASALRTRLNSKEEEKKYNAVVANIDKQTRKKLEALLKSGILLNSESTDNSTVLDNLYKIVSTQRAVGLDAKSLLKDVITTLNNPYVVTQQFGDIPKNKQQSVLNIHANSPSGSNDINVLHSGTCVAASIEFTLAQEMPAEFARIAEGLTSPKVSADKKIHLNMLADNTLDAIWLLNAFEIPYNTNNFDSATLQLKPDNYAIVRAQIQTTDRDPGERSPIDVLMQSTFMQIGSQQSYDTLTDKRAGKFNQNDKGLIEFEKTFVESIIEDKNKISMLYQTVDENSRLIGYETDMETLKRHLTQSLDSGNNVILGYTQTDNNNVIINGHEITVIGYKQNPKTQKLTFICNDTDDGVSRPIEYSEDFLLPKVHHAALPKAIVEKDIQLYESWIEGLEMFQEMRKKQNMAA